MKPKIKILNSKIRNELLFKLNNVKQLFTHDIIVDRLRKGLPINQYMILHQIIETNINKLSDMKLIWLAAKCDFCFVAGEHGYNSDECIAINELNDILCDIKNM